MNTSTPALQAFYKLSKLKNFSLAADELHITQSALSQRIKKLEDDLEQSLFIREKSGSTLTESGQALFQYCLENEKLTDDLLHKLNKRTSQELAGNLFVGSFSTFTRSKLLPLISDFYNKNSAIKIKIIDDELYQLDYLLEKNHVDYIFTTSIPKNNKYEYQQIDKEENVLIVPLGKAGGRDLPFIDHDEKDMVTSNFWQQQKKPVKKIKRIYLDNIYNIIDAVEYGMGQAIVPLHLTKKRKVTVVKKLKAIVENIYVVRKKQSYYSQLQKTFWTYINDEIDLS